jgi:hypothetical protein
VLDSAGKRERKSVLNRSSRSGVPQVPDPWAKDPFIYIFFEKSINRSKKKGHTPIGPAE